MALSGDLLRFNANLTRIATILTRVVGELRGCEKHASSDDKSPMGTLGIFDKISGNQFLLLV